MLGLEAEELETSLMSEETFAWLCRAVIGRVGRLVVGRGV